MGNKDNNDNDYDKQSVDLVTNHSPLLNSTAHSRAQAGFPTPGGPTRSSATWAAPSASSIRAPEDLVPASKFLYLWMNPLTSDEFIDFRYIH